MYVKWKGYDNSFNNWIHKKDIVQNESIFWLWIKKPEASFRWEKLITQDLKMISGERNQNISL